MVASREEIYEHYTKKAYEHQEQYMNFDVDRFLDYIKECKPKKLFWLYRTNQSVATINKMRRARDKWNRFLETGD